MLNSTKYAAIAIVGAGLVVAANAPASACGGYYGSAVGYGYGYGCAAHVRDLRAEVNYWRRLAGMPDRRYYGFAGTYGASYTPRPYQYGCAYGAAYHVSSCAAHVRDLRAEVNYWRRLAGMPNRRYYGFAGAYGAAYTSHPYRCGGAYGAAYHVSSCAAHVRDLRAEVNYWRRLAGMPSRRFYGRI